MSQKKRPITPEQKFVEIFSQLSQQHNSHDVWHDFIVMSACSISNTTDLYHYTEREERYMSICSKYSKEEVSFFSELLSCLMMAITESPNQDFLGSLFTKLNLYNNRHGQFFTPYPICEFMAQTMIGDNLKEQVKQHGVISIADPCCGAGALLIAGVNLVKKRLRNEGLNPNAVIAYAQDIDETVALMCYIQLSLLGINGKVKVGNSLTDPITDNDSLDNYWLTPACLINFLFPA